MTFYPVTSDRSIGSPVPTSWVVYFGDPHSFGLHKKEMNDGRGEGIKKRAMFANGVTKDAGRLK